MSNIIDLLERLGQDAQLRNATSAEVENRLKDAGVDAPLRAAIAAGDQRRIESLLGIGSNVCCLIYMPKEEPNEGDIPGTTEQPAPGEEELIPALSNIRRTAT
jgi:hypothetical protein